VSVLILSTSDIYGGAARASYRLHQGLQTAGISSKMLVQYKLTDDSSVMAPERKLDQAIAKLKHRIDSLPLSRYNHREASLFSVNWMPDSLVSEANKLNPDVINLHWCNSGFLKIENLSKFRKPVLWTLHDMWAFTGGCHYSLSCTRYNSGCGACPQLGSQQEHDLSSKGWLRKQREYGKLRLIIITPSKWLSECSRSSALLKEARIEHIPNGIDTHLFKPVGRTTARSILNLASDKKLILFGSAKTGEDPRKGLHYLHEALKKIYASELKNSVELLIFGAGKLPSEYSLEMKTHFLGQLRDEISLVIAYSAADCFVAPSIQDNLPNTIMEAMSCGTPCVSFKVGGIPELIDHQLNGFLASPLDTENLAYGIGWVLEDEQRWLNLSNSSRKKVQHCFDLSLQVQRYCKLFEEHQNTKVVNN
jgi:glycosyltransferase involved in cell wall biosynthesis